MKLIIYLEKETIDKVKNTKEDEIEIGDETFYAYCGELYASYKSSGYAMRVKMIAKSNVEEVIKEITEEILDGNEYECGSEEKTLTINHDDAIDSLNMFGLVPDTECQTITDIARNYIAMDIARDISNQYFDSVFEHECDMRDVSHSLVSMILNGEF